MPTIYLAGPEVFLPDAMEVMGEKRRLAAHYGFSVTGPGADENSPSLTVPLTAHAIYQRNHEAMSASDYCLANITPFRSISGDVGTIYEIGFMIALGRKVWAYSNDHRPYGARVWSDWYKQSGPQAHKGTDGLAIETYGMADNLMIDGGIAFTGGQVLWPVAPVADIERDLTSYEEALKRMAATIGV